MLDKIRKAIENRLNKKYISNPTSEENLWSYIEKTERELEIAEGELRALREKIKALADRTGFRGIFLEFVGPRRALVAIGPLKEEVLITPNVEESRLKKGCEVLITLDDNGKMLSEDRGRSAYGGRVGKIHMVLDSERVLIEEAGHIAMFILAEGVECQTGDEVRYDPISQVVFEVIGEKRESAFALAEQPKTTFDDVKGLCEEKEFLKEKIIYPIIYSDKFEKYGIKPARGILFHGPPGCGKAQPLDSLVLTPNGYVKMGDILPGSFVSTPDGNSAKVLETFPQGEIEIYKVNFSDGTSAECCENHLWKIRNKYDIAMKRHGRVVKLKDIMYKVKLPSGRRKYSIPMTKPVKFVRHSVPLDPYLLGCLLGDGSFSSKKVGFTTMDREIIDTLTPIIRRLGCKFTRHDRYNYDIVEILKQSGPVGRAVESITDSGEVITYDCISSAVAAGFSKHGIYKTCSGRQHTHGGRRWRFLQKLAAAHHPIKNALHQLCLFGTRSSEKFVPHVYKINSRQIRLSLLRGLMDTDGCVDKKGMTVFFSSTSYQLIMDVKFLVESLGGKAKVGRPRKSKYRKNTGEVVETGNVSHNLFISMPPDINPFLVSRKRLRVCPKTKYPPTRYIEEICYVGKKKAQCILIDHPDHLYITNDFIVTHNTYLGEAVFNESMKIRGGKTAGKGFFLVNGPEILSKWAGNTELAIREVFEAARREANTSGFPSVIFWDEVDSVAGRRKDVDTFTPEKTVVPTLLSEIHGINNTNNVIFIGATNMPNLIDPALMRPGRLGDAIIEIPRPESNAAMDILDKEFNRESLPAALTALLKEGLTQRIVDHCYANTKPLAYASRKSGAKQPLMRQELVSGALFAQIGEDLVRRACMAEIDESRPPTIEDAIDMVDNILLTQIGVLDAGVKSGFTIDTSDYVVDVSLDG